jgi:hypothetical protein
MQPQCEARFFASAVLHSHLLLVHYRVVHDCGAKQRRLGLAKKGTPDDKAVAMKRGDLRGRERCHLAQLNKKKNDMSWLGESFVKSDGSVVDNACVASLRSL